MNFSFIEFIKKFGRKLSSRFGKSEKKINLSTFLKKYFAIKKNANIIQIGAMDGVSCDPLRPYLTFHKGNVILVEALNFYCDKLNILYSDQSNISICNALVSSKESENKFFYIDPQIADEMDGNGPFNKWAHGQGSLNKNTIIKWIYKNRFRGPIYVKNIYKYIDSILETNMKSMTIDSICKTYQIKKIDLLLIDVQGAEYEVLKNLKYFKIKPKFIIYEDDSSLSRRESFLLEKLLKTEGYLFLLGVSDKLWIKI
tara:strand:- start:259 stop:1026 length:768 start_codon:yes stop_codon:yes gene_type:complete